jgi:hypothetical protein
MTIETITQDYRGTTTEVVVITNEDGSTVSMLKSTYDEMIAQREASPL